MRNLDQVPRFIAESLETLELEAFKKVRTEPNKDFASGYMSCLADLDDMLEGYSNEERARQNADREDAIKRFNEPQN